MTDRRSSRARKTVDYSKFSGGDSDNDDDFRESSNQSTKRKKNESSPPKSVKVKLTKVDEDSYKIEEKKTEKQPKDNEDSAPKKRPSLSDKVFQRHLNVALEISKQQDSEALSKENENANSLLLNGEGKTENDEVDCSIPNDVSTRANGKPVCKEEPKRNKSKGEDDEWNDASSSASDEDDVSDWSDEDEDTKVKKPAVKSRISRRSQDRDDESDWSDDDGKKKSKKPAVKKGEPKKQPKKLLSPKTSQSPKPMMLKCSKPSKKIPGSSTVSPGLKPNVKTVKTPGTPCQVISSPVKLPPKGIRLGLSRKVSGKPLHSVIKVQH